MPQELLYGAQIATGFKHVAGKGMAQGVGMDPLSWHPGWARAFAACTLRDSDAAPEKKGSGPRSRGWWGSARRESDASDDGLQSWPAEGNAAVFWPFL